MGDPLGWAAAIILVMGCYYVLFRWDDPAIKRFNRVADLRFTYSQLKALRLAVTSDNWQAEIGAGNWDLDEVEERDLFEAIKIIEDTYPIGADNG